MTLENLIEAWIPFQRNTFFMYSVRGVGFRIHKFLTSLRILSLVGHMFFVSQRYMFYDIYGSPATLSRSDQSSCICFNRGQVKLAADVSTALVQWRSGAQS